MGPSSFSGQCQVKIAILQKQAVVPPKAVFSITAYFGKLQRLYNQQQRVAVVIVYRQDLFCIWVLLPLIGSAAGVKRWYTQVSAQRVAC